MNCAHAAIRDFVFVSGLILCVLGAACLLISIARGRSARIGDELREICAFDDEVVELALSNMRTEHGLVLGSAQYGRRLRRFHDGDAV